MSHLFCDPRCHTPSKCMLQGRLVTGLSHRWHSFKRFFSWVSFGLPLQGSSVLVLGGLVPSSVLSICLGPQIGEISKDLYCTGYVESVASHTVAVLFSEGAKLNSLGPMKKGENIHSHAHGTRSKVPTRSTNFIFLLAFLYHLRQKFSMKGKKVTS